jgi:CoA:oxalate CoA-transferase
MREIESWTSQHTADHCEAVLMIAGVPCSRYRTVGEWVADPELRADGSFAEVTDAAGPMLVPNPPFRMSGTAIHPGARVSAVGEDRVQILRSAGFSDAEIEALDLPTGRPSR